jgi:hypothetical protein
MTMEIFLPESWCDDEDRREQASVPETPRQRTQTKMAIDSVQKAKHATHAIF